MKRKKSNIDTGVIICGGKGTRMGNDFSYTQKCLLPIAGLPILKYIIEIFRINNIKKIYFVLNHHKEDVEYYLDSLKYNETEFNIIHSNSKGTIGVLKKVSKYINEPFVYCHGNIIFPTFWLSDLLKKYKENMMALFTVSSVDLINTHPHIIGKNNIVNKIFYPNGNRICEKSFCALELTIFSPDIFNILKNKDDAKRLCEFFSEEILQKNKFCYYQTEGMWIHIEIPNDLKKASSYVKTITEEKNE